MSDFPCASQFEPRAFLSSYYRPVKNLIVASFQQLHQILITHYSEEEQGLIAAPSPEHISILLSAMLLKRPDSVLTGIEKCVDLKH